MQEETVSPSFSQRSVNCKISAQGSVGAIIGHAGANERTTATIDSCTDTNNTLTATDGDVWKVVVGTAQLGNVVITNITESGNTLAQYSDAEKTTSVPVETGVKRNYYGRAVLGSTGALTMDGEKITQ